MAPKNLKTQLDEMVEFGKGINLQIEKAQETPKQDFGNDNNSSSSNNKYPRTSESNC